MNNLKLSTLSKTWIFDVDGTIVKHNGHLKGGDEILPNVKDFFARKIAATDKVILLTAREEKYIEQLKIFLQEEGICFDHLISNLPHGERILVNDKKPSGLPTAFAVNVQRDGILNINVDLDPTL